MSNRRRRTAERAKVWSETSKTMVYEKNPLNAAQLNKHELDEYMLNEDEEEE